MTFLAGSSRTREESQLLVPSVGFEPTLSGYIRVARSVRRGVRKCPTSCGYSHQPSADECCRLPEFVGVCIRKVEAELVGVAGRIGGGD